METHELVVIKAREKLEAIMLVSTKYVVSSLPHMLSSKLRPVHLLHTLVDVFIPNVRFFRLVIRFSFA